MKKLARMVTMGGLGLLAALAASVGPAQATPAKDLSAARPSSYEIQLQDGVQVAGFYRTYATCELAGRFGERRAYWDDYDCDPVRVGFRSGAWALQVGSVDNWNRVGFTVPVRAIYGFPLQLRPVWFGQFGPGRPVLIRPGHPGWGRPHHPGYVHPGHHGYGRPGNHDYGRPGHYEDARPGNTVHVRPGDPFPGQQNRAGIGSAPSAGERPGRHQNRN